MSVTVGVLRYQAPEEVLQMVRDAYQNSVEFDPFEPFSAEETRDHIKEHGYTVTLLRPYTLIQLALEAGMRFIYERDGKLMEIVAVPIDDKPFEP